MGEGGLSVLLGQRDGLGGGADDGGLGVLDGGALRLVVRIVLDDGGLSAGPLLVPESGGVSCGVLMGLGKVVGSVVPAGGGRADIMPGSQLDDLDALHAHLDQDHGLAGMLGQRAHVPRTVLLLLVGSTAPIDQDHGLAGLDIHALHHPACSRCHLADFNAQLTQARCLVGSNITTLFTPSTISVMPASEVCGLGEVVAAHGVAVGWGHR
jgi:hypothetical protein